MTPMIEAHGLSKRFGKTVALDGLDLVAESGQVLAVLGPNGAGKTTFVRLVATLLRPDGGSLLVAGHDVRRRPEAVRRIIGLAGQFAAVEPTMTGRENLEMVAQLFGQDRRSARANTVDVLATMGLSDAGDRLVRTYSGGMRRRLDLGASLVGSPRLLLLDEPTTGLDPRSRMELWDAIATLVSRGTDVLLTTQYLDEADHLASRIVIIDRGRVVADGTPAELKQRGGHNVVEVHVRRRPGPARGLPPSCRGMRGSGRRAAGHRRDHPPGHQRHRVRDRPADGGPAVPRRRRGGDRGHRHSPTEARRGVPRPDRANTSTATPRARHPTPCRRIQAPPEFAFPIPFTSLSNPLHRRRPPSSITTTVDHPRGPSRCRPACVEHTTGPVASVVPIAKRQLLKFLRTPQLIVLGTAQGAMFLLIFRYVFGGALTGGGLSYVDFLVPGFVATSALFTGMGAASGIAEDLQFGFIDRLRSLPIPRYSVLVGRAVADMIMLVWSLAVTAGIGFAVGFRLHGSVAGALGAFGLCVVFGFAFEWVFISLGMIAGNAQAAQGISFMVFPLTFVSSAYVPTSSMPGWMQVFANHQPITYMVDAVRILAEGPAAQKALGHSASYFSAWGLVWSVAIVAVFAPLAVARYRRG